MRGQTAHDNAGTGTDRKHDAARIRIHEFIFTSVNTHVKRAVRIGSRCFPLVLRCSIGRGRMDRARGNRDPLTVRRLKGKGIGQDQFGPAFGGDVKKGRLI
jgi:hypothetical protein